MWGVWDWMKEQEGTNNEEVRCCGVLFWRKDGENEEVRCGVLAGNK